MRGWRRLGVVAWALWLPWAHVWIQEEVQDYEQWWARFWLMLVLPCFLFWAAGWVYAGFRAPPPPT